MAEKLTDRLPVRHALITGACSGIGLGLTRHLLSSSTIRWRIILADINEHAAAAIIQDINDRYAFGTEERVTFTPCDVSSWDSNVKMFRSAMAFSGGRLDFFAANAGVAHAARELTKFKTIQSQDSGSDEAEFDDGPTPLDPSVVNVNLLGVLYGVRLMVYYVRQTRRRLELAHSAGNDKTATTTREMDEGSLDSTTNKDGEVEALSSDPYHPKLVITSSCVALYYLPTDPLYAACKTSHVGLVRSIFNELWRTDGIALNAILPGLVKTSIFPSILLDSLPKGRDTSVEQVIKGFDELIDGIAAEEEQKQTMKMDSTNSTPSSTADVKGTPDNSELRKDNHESVSVKSEPQQQPRFPGEKRYGQHKRGQILEVWGENLHYRDPVEYPDDSARWVFEDPEGFWSGNLIRK